MWVLAVGCLKSLATLLQRHDNDNQNRVPTFPVSIIIAAMVIILFGLAEVVTGVTHQFFGLTITKINISTYLGVTLGLFYL